MRGERGEESEKCKKGGGGGGWVGGGGGGGGGGQSEGQGKTGSRNSVCQWKK